MGTYARAMFFLRNGAYEPLVTYPISLQLEIHHLVTVARNAAIDRLQPNQRALDARRLGALQRVPADEFSLFHLQKAVQTGLPDIDRLGNLVSIQRQLALQSQRVACSETAGHDAELFAGLQHFIPDARAGRFIGGT